MCSVSVYTLSPYIRGKSTLRHHQRIIGIERTNVHVFENTYVCIVSDVNTMDEAHLRLSGAGGVSGESLSQDSSPTVVSSMIAAVKK